MSYGKYKAVMLIISIIILILMGWYANPAKIMGVLTQSNIILILLAFIISNINMILRVYRWKIIIKNLSFGELFPIQMIGLAIGNFTPGKISDPIKSIIIKSMKKINIAKTLPSIIWERIFDIVSLVLLSIIALQLITATFDMLLLSMVCIAVFFLVILFLILVLYKKSFGLFLVRIVKKFKGVNKLGKKFVDAFYRQRISKTGLLSSFVLSFLTWVIEGVMLYLILLAVGINMNIILLVGITSLSFTIGIASTLPGGLGSTEVVMAVLLAVVGVPESIAISAVLVSRLLSFWYVSFLGAVSFIHLGKRMKIKNIF